MDLDSLTPPQLLAKAQAVQKAALLKQAQDIQAKLPGALPDNPVAGDLFDSDAARAAASFGDFAGTKDTLTKKGWTDVRQNKDGDLVAQAPDGRYFKDASGLKHPLNWAESHLGGALPTAGMLAGGTVAGAASVPGGPIVVPDAIAGAGAGGAAGEALRIGLGKLLGTYQGGAGDAAKDTGKELASSAASEGVGKLVGKIPLPGGRTVDSLTTEALQKLIDGGKGFSSWLTGKMTGVDSDAALRLLNRPKQVMGATKPGNALQVARQAQEELAARARTEGELISTARKNFAANHGVVPIDTRPSVTTVDQALAANAPNSSGRSGMAPDELAELEKLRDTDLSTTLPRGQDMLPPAVIPQKSAGELQKTADWLQQQVTPRAYATDQPIRTSKSTGTYQRLLGQLKDAFHVVDPELGAADARFHDYAGKAELLGPLEKDAQGEGFAANLFGKNRGARQEAAQELLPNSYEGMADIGANKAFSGDSRLSHFGPSAPAILRMGTAGLGMGMGYATGHPELGVLGMGLATVTSPAAHKYGLYIAGKYGLPVLEALAKNPQLAPVLLDSSDAQKGVWSLLRGSQNGQGQSR